MPGTETVNIRRPRVIFLRHVYLGKAGGDFWIGAVQWVGSKTINDRSQEMRRVVTSPATLSGSDTDVSRTLTAPATFGDRLHTPTSDTDGIYWPPPETVAFPDGVFWVNEEEDGANTIHLSPDNLTAGAGEWDFLPLQYEHEKQQTWNFYGIAVNGTSAPLRLGRSTSTIRGRLHPVFSPFYPNNARVEGVTTGGGAPPTSIQSVFETDPDVTFAIHAVRSIEMYNGSVVYGGFHAWNPTTDDSELDGRDLSHWIVFASPTGSDYGAYQVDLTSSLQIGTSANEPVTKVVTNAVATNTMGIRAQLMVFTTDKVVFYDGVPPVPGENYDTTFQTVGLGEVGCRSPKSVVKTPAGVMFLGTDGMVYLAPIEQPGPPVPVGRAIQPELERLSQAQLGLVAATYFDNHYMLAFPSGTTFNNREYWADVRRISLGSRDAGIQWVGPMTGRFTSVFATSSSPNSRKILMGGSSVSGAINQLHIKELGSDPITQYINSNATNATSDEVPIRVDAESNPMDFGSAHTDKRIRKIKIGVKTDDEVDIKISVSAISVDTSNGTITTLLRETTETVTPSFGTTPYVTTSATAPREGWELPEYTPPTVMRGRAFVLRIQEEPGDNSTKDPKVTFSDMAILVREVGRK